MLGLATVFALILDAQRVRFQRLGRIAIFLPYAVPTIIGSMLWGMMYLPSVSPFVSVMHTLFGVTSINFFGSRAVYLSIANIGIWGGTGFNMMVLYTSLRSLPQEVYEAARLDGLSELQIALRIKLPMIRPSVIMTAIFSTIATLQVFNEPNDPATGLLRRGLRDMDPADEGVSRHVSPATTSTRRVGRVDHHRGADVRRLVRRAAPDEPPHLRRR